MYELETMLMDFTEEELAAGAEHVAMDQVKLTVHRKKSNDNGAEETEPEQPGEIAMTAAVWEEKNPFGYAGSFQPEVWIDEKHGELVRTKCRCTAFSQTGYACEHVTAALLAYVVRKEGKGRLEASPLDQMLAKRTGIEHPFRPGILRKTDRDLTGFLEEYQTRSRMQLAAKIRTDLTIHVACYLFSMGDECYLELKAGEKRLYVVKNAKEFLDAYMEHTPVTLGKSLEFVPHRDIFDPKSLVVMDFLLELYREAQMENGRKLFGGTYAQETRRILLSGTAVDHFMEKIAVNGVFVLPNETERLQFVPDERKAGLKIRKLEYGAALSVQSAQQLAESPNWLYLKDQNEIYRIPSAGSGLTKRIFSLIRRKESIFVSEQDLPAVCRELLPVLEPSMSLTYEGMTPEAYLPPKPVFEIYLDYPQENMISCQAFARYRDQKYQMFAREDYKDNRDFAKEHAAAEKIRTYFNSYEESTAMLCRDGNEQDLFVFLTEDIPKLEALGEVYISDRMKKLRVVPLSSVSVGVSLESGLLELQMKSEVFSREELAEILSAYDRKKRYHRLRNGMFISYQEEQKQTWDALADSFRSAGNKNPEAVRLPLFRALYLDEMLKEKDGIRYSKSREYRKLLKSMQAVENSDFEVPKSLEEVLRNYQREGFFWLKLLKNNGFGGILADDMGLGKTLQVLAFLLSEKEEGKSGSGLRTLIVTPASLIYNWKREAELFTPQLKVCVISGTAAERKKKLQRAVTESEVWITSYDLLKRDVELYEGVDFSNEIVDEAQFIKNQTTHAAKSVRLVNSSFRLALTGTPIENRLSELWSIFDYLMPGFLYSYAKFRKEIELPAVSEQDEDAMNKMRRMVHPFVLRRLKRDVLKELPEKQEETVSVGLDGEQRRLYEAHAQRLKMYLEKQSEEEFRHNRLEILAELTKLRQLCCGPELLLEGYRGPNAKLETCMELIHQAIDGGHKMLLFSQFTSVLDRIGARLKEDGIAYYRIDGSVSKERRMEQAEAFQSDDVPVFCISLKAGGTGLNLTAADIVIHYDPWWNLAAQNQATDRAHRIGQKNAVNVYQLIAEDTIEQKIQALQQSKHELAEEVLTGEGVQNIGFDREELLALLEERE